MPVGKLNFTDRIAISRRHVVVAVEEAKGKPGFWFDADVELGSYSLPGDALVFVEAYRKTQRARFRFGTVDNVVKPPQNKRRLSEMFPSSEGILFRVKVTNPAGGLIRAEVDRIRAGGEDESGSGLSMLPVDHIDLGEECWRLNFEGEAPVLEVNKRLPPDSRAAIKNPEFVGLVYPAVLREILIRILRIEKHALEDGEHWAADWVRFAENKLGMRPPPDREERDDSSSEKVDEWVGDAVTAFARRIRAFRGLEKEAQDQEERG